MLLSRYNDSVVRGLHTKRTRRILRNGAPRKWACGGRRRFLLADPARATLRPSGIARTLWPWSASLMLIVAVGNDPFRLANSRSPTALPVRRPRRAGGIRVGRRVRPVPAGSRACRSRPDGLPPAPRSRWHRGWWRDGEQSPRWYAPPAGGRGRGAAPAR